MFGILADVPNSGDAAVAAGVGIFIIVYLLFAALGFVGFVLAILSLLDNGKHSEEAYVAAGTTKQTALIIAIVGLFCGITGFYSWFVIRKKVIAAEGGAPA